MPESICIESMNIPKRNVMRLTGLNFHPTNKMMLKIALSSIKSVSRSSFFHDFIIQIIPNPKTCIDMHPRGGELNSLKACSFLGPLKNKNTHTSAPTPMLNGPKIKQNQGAVTQKPFKAGLKWSWVGSNNKDCRIFLVIPQKSWGGDHK